MWVHKPGRHNKVIDVLSMKEVASYVGLLSLVVEVSHPNFHSVIYVILPSFFFVYIMSP